MVYEAVIYQIPGARTLQAKLNQLTSYVPPPPLADVGTPRKILMIHAHPDPVHSYSAAIANQIESSAKQAGHEIRRISLYDAGNGYSPTLTKDEHRLKNDIGEDIDRRTLSRDVKEHLKSLRWCDTLLFVYPTWWMNTPAAVKGFLDRTLVHDIAFGLPPSRPDGTPSSNGLIPKLTNIKQIMGVSTYGAPFPIVTLAGDNGRRMIAHAIRPIISPGATVAWIGLYDIDNATQQQRTTFLNQVGEMVKKL